MLKPFFVVLRKCTVAVKDVRDVEFSVEVTAETLDEAVTAAVASWSTSYMRPLIP
jgi:hypothetical protein